MFLCKLQGIKIWNEIITIIITNNLDKLYARSVKHFYNFYLIGVVLFGLAVFLSPKKHRHHNYKVQKIGVRACFEKVYCHNNM